MGVAAVPLKGLKDVRSLQGFEMCEVEFEEKFDGEAVFQKYQVEFMALKGDVVNRLTLLSGNSRVEFR